MIEYSNGGKRFIPFYQPGINYHYANKISNHQGGYNQVKHGRRTY